MVYEVKSPILGLEQVVRVAFEEVDEVFARITSLDDSNIQLQMVNPYALREYSFDVPKYIQLLLEINESSKLLVYCVLMLQNPMERSRANFLAPIMFNKDNGTCAQIALSVKDYPDFQVSEEIGHFVRPA